MASHTSTSSVLLRLLTPDWTGKLVPANRLATDTMPPPVRHACRQPKCCIVHSLEHPLACTKQRGAASGMGVIPRVVVEER